MKKVTKFFMAAIFSGMCNFGYAQVEPKYYDQYDASVHKGKPSPNEIVLNSVSVGDLNRALTENGWYEELMKKAKQDYPSKIIDIREMRLGSSHGTSITNKPLYNGPVFATIVWTSKKEQFEEALSLSVNKALCDVREGSRLSIDQVSVPYTMDRSDFKDGLTTILLNKGYRVVAKEYFEKLYQEQQDQQSGIYNEKTTVQENNFSAVGYYINVKVTETFVRVQVVNVSTGEYEGNATVNF